MGLYEKGLRKQKLKARVDKLGNRVIKVFCRNVHIHKKLILKASSSASVVTQVFYEMETESEKKTRKKHFLIWCFILFIFRFSRKKFVINA